MKGQGGLVIKSTLAALVQDSTPLTLHWLLYAFKFPVGYEYPISSPPPLRRAPAPHPPSPAQPPQRSCLSGMHIHSRTHR